jgi:protein TonB
MVLNKKYRLYFAFCMAILIHFMIMGMDITKGPVTMPDFHIPRSVNVFLGQTSKPQIITESQEMKEAVMEKEEAVPVQYNSTKKEVSQVQEQVIVDKSNPPLVPIEKSSEPIIREKKTPDVEQPLPENNTATVLPESKAEAAAQVSNTGKNKVDPGKKHIGAVRMARPMYRENSPPVYPKLARKRGYEGTVVLQVLVNKQGRVDDLHINESSHHAMLDRAALNSVRKWYFEPGRKGTEKIDMWVKVPVTFKLQE